MRRQYAYYLLPTSLLTVVDAEAALAEFNRTRDSGEGVPEMRKALATDGLYFATLPDTLSSDLSSVGEIDSGFAESVAALGVMVREAWVGE